MNPNKNIKPPRFADRILEWFCSSDVVESLQGDLHEFYELRRTKGMSKSKADFHFIMGVFSACRPFAFKRKLWSNSNYIVMLQHNIKITWRTLVKDKMYSSIKIGGFAVGIAICLLIGLFVRDELSIDKQYKNSGNIYRVLNATTNPEASWTRASCLPAPIKGALEENFPEVERVGRLISFDGWYDAGSNLFRPSEEVSNIYEERFAYADQELIDMLEIPMVYGTRSNVLSEPKSILISKRKADKYYPDQDPVGRTIVLNDDDSSTFVIGGVMENLQNTHLSGFDFFITLSGREFWDGEQNDWCCWNYSPYVQIKSGTDAQVLESKLGLIQDRYILKWLRDNDKKYGDDLEQYGYLELQPVGDIYLNSKDVSDFLTVSDSKIVMSFSAIAIFILLLACINFINLSTAKSANRAKEVGLRKVVGSHKINLVGQFLTESIFYSVVSVVIGAIIAWFAMPFFNMLAGKELTFPLTEWWPIPALILFAIVIGIISGLYPAFYLSSFKPITVLRGKLSKGSRDSFLRSGLVIFQFATSIVLIVGAFNVSEQMDYILNKDLGFNKDQVIQIHGTNTMRETQRVFKDEILRLSDVQFASASNFLPIKGTSRNGTSYYKSGRSKIDKGAGGQIWWSDSDYLDAMGMKLLDGRMLSHDIASDTLAFVINQAMVKELGLENPVGAKITRGWGDHHVVGVVEDFHFESLRGNKIQPLAIGRGDYGYADILSVRTNTKDMQATLAAISEIWEDFMPHQPIRYSFMDESYAMAYEDVKRAGNLFTIFAIFGVLVACIGLFGLSAFMAEQRRKEISIRKVLGASFQTIFKILTLNFLKLLFISLIVAIPVGWYTMKSWLDDFEYRIEMGWGIFAIAGLIVIVIAILTVSFESIKAAVVNPANGLRTE